jgi:LSD1 subclass zinc finger protein
MPRPPPSRELGAFRWRVRSSRPMRPSPLVLCLGLASLPLLGCGGTHKAVEDEWSAASEMPEEKSRPLHETETLNAAPHEASSIPGAPGWGGSASALLGVRHDLMLSKGAHPVRCACLSAEVGPAADPSFFWTGGAPGLGPNAVAFAIGARGIDCPGGDPDESRRRPSISAVDEENNDIIIEVEDLPEGRPLASGAIIPQPGAGRSIYIRQRRAGQVYAKGAPGGRCKVR